MKNLNSYWTHAISKLDLIASNDDLEDMLAKLMSSSTPTVLGFLNAHGFNSMLDTPSFFNSVKCMDVVLRDGVGVEMLMRLQGKKPGKNMNGTDFIPELLEKYRGKKIAILATKDAYLNRTKNLLEKNLSVKVIVAENGFHPDDYYLSQLLNTPVDIILLGMGMPKQERIACMLKAKLNYPVVIICGGAIVDFLAGRFSRAPAVVRKVGMEWLYRLFLEPVRLFKRYVIGNVIFVMRMLYYRFIA